MDHSFKKIFYRATHRGTRELDLMMLKFMNNVFQNLTQVERKEVEYTIEQDDEILHNWLVNKFVDKM